MSDNPQYGSAPLFALPALRVLGLVGRDAIAFAQAQFMNDVAALGDGQWQWNGWLDPKGRVQALFALVRRDAETLWLVTTADVDAMAAALQRFVFRSRVRIAKLDVAAAGQLARPANAIGSRIAEAGSAVEVDLSGDAGTRTLRLAPGPCDPAVSHADEERWWALDITHGWPGLPATPLDAWTPQQLSLERLGAFSVKKGCYPGQEIVARTHFLGRARRGLARIRATALEPRGMLQDGEGRDVAQVVCVVGDEALVVAPLDAAGPLCWRGSPVETLPLAGGLARPAS